MTRLVHRCLADGISAITLLLVVVAIVRLYSVEPSAFAGVAAFVVTFAVVGWLLWRRLPGNPIGWCLSLSALVTAVSFAGHAWATIGVERGDSGSLVALAATLDASSSALLSCVYVLLVGASARLLPVGPSMGVAASTLGAAALFQPLRRRVQTAVDKRFNRARYDTDRTVDTFARRLRDEVDLDAVWADLLQVVHGTVQPTVVGLWLRKSGR